MRQATIGEGDSSEGFEAFWSAYPVREDMSAADARRAFGALTAAEREAATRSAERYREACTAARRDRPKHAANWLRQREFEQVSTLDAKGTPVSERVFVEVGSEEWRAWTSYRGKSIPTGEDKATRRVGWWFQSRWPPPRDPAAR